MIRIVPAILLCALALLSHASDDKPVRILFIGNSLTMQNNLPAMLKAIAAGAQPAVNIETAMVAAGGYTLEKHWDQGKAQAKIQEGNWDYVVLQEHSTGSKGEATDEGTQRVARQFDELAKKNHAKTLLYMNWALQKTPEDQAKITAFYNQLGKDLNEVVVPVGLARENAVKADPKLNLFVKDGKHPTPAGTYLAACTFFATITKHSSKKLPGKIADPAKPGKFLVDLPADQAEFLQGIADKTVLGK